MLLRFDPFRDFGRLTDEMISGMRTPRMMPMDVFRSGDHYVILFDLPGVDPGSIDLSAEENVLTVTAERTARGTDGVQFLVAERPTGSFSRQLVLGEGLDTDKVSAGYQNGVLTVSIPVAERAKPRRIEVSQGESSQSDLPAGDGARVIEGQSMQRPAAVGDAAGAS